MGVHLEKAEIGSSVVRKGRGWVQTERAAHEEWGKLWLKHPAAAAVLHHLVAFMQEKNAVVVGQKVLADRLSVSERTVRRGLEALAKENWIQVVRIGKGREAAYVVNDRVAWGQPRDQLRLSMFSAAVVADVRDQDVSMLDAPPLRKIPTLYPGEHQLPSGDSLPPPSQPFLPDMEPDLPAIAAEPHSAQKGTMKEHMNDYAEPSIEEQSRLVAAADEKDEGLYEFMDAVAVEMLSAADWSDE